MNNITVTSGFIFVVVFLFIVIVLNALAQPDVVCNQNSPCKEGFSCVEGQCVPLVVECQSNLDCLGNGNSYGSPFTQCVNRVCYPPSVAGCREDSNCPLGEYCGTSKICVPINSFLVADTTLSDNCAEAWRNTY